MNNFKIQDPSPIPKDQQNACSTELTGNPIKESDECALIPV
jgi:hypothetical protein